MEPKYTMKCIHHDNEWVTNFCKSEGCLTALCPRCINNHFNYHQSCGRPSEIECIATLSCEMLAELGDLKFQLYEDEEKATRYSGNYRDIMASLMTRVSQAKERLLQKIDEYFIVIQQEVDYMVRDKLGNFTAKSWKALQQRIDSQITELEGLEFSLKSEPLGKHFVGFYHAIQQAQRVHIQCLQRFQDFQDITVPEIDYNSELYKDLLLLLDNYIVLKMEWPARKQVAEAAGPPKISRKEDRCILRRFLES